MKVYKLKDENEEVRFGEGVREGVGKDGMGGGGEEVDGVLGLSLGDMGSGGGGYGGRGGGEGGGYERGWV